MSASIGNMAVTESGDKQYKVFRSLLLLSFWTFGLCVTVLYVCITPFMILWMGEKYTFSMPIVIVLLVDLYLTGMMSPISSFRTSNGLFVQGQYRPLVMAIINIVVSVMLVKPLGVLGVLLGTVISRLTTQIWYDPYLIYKHVFHKSLLLYIRKMSIYSLFTVVCCLTCKWISGNFFVVNAYVDLLIKAIFSVIFFTLFFFIFFHRLEEFGYLKETGFRLFKELKKKIDRHQ